MHLVGYFGLGEAQRWKGIGHPAKTPGFSDIFSILVWAFGKVSPAILFHRFLQMILPPSCQPLHSLDQSGNGAISKRFCLNKPLPMEKAAWLSPFSLITATILKQGH